MRKKWITGRREEENGRVKREGGRKRKERRKKERRSKREDRHGEGGRRCRGKLRAGEETMNDDIPRGAT